MSIESLVEALVAEAKPKLPPTLGKDDLFQHYCIGLLLGDELESDQVASGITDGPDDAGIDAIYFFIDGIPVADIEDLEQTEIGKCPKVAVHIFQCKNTTTFQGEALIRLRTGLQDVFSTDWSKAQSKAFNRSIAAKAKLFGEIFRRVQRQRPSLAFCVYYATRGDSAKLNDRIEADAAEIRGWLTKRFPGAEADFKFIGARQIVDHARRTPHEDRHLRFCQEPISPTGDDWVGLVRLSDFYSFITDEAGTLAKDIFEANVRNFAGNVKVNADILDTLENNNSDDFWWLNNGITVVCDKAHRAGNLDMLTIERPLIVNGLQTSNMVWRFFSKRHSVGDTRNILVRVVAPRDDATRDRIIRATNQQTTIEDYQLRATERIHRDIEHFFRLRGLIYERRRNYSRGRNLDRRKVVTISYLAQCVMAVMLGRPAQARANPAALFKDQTAYAEVFNEKFGPEPYRSVLIVREAQKQLERTEPQQHVSNMRYYLGFLWPRMALEKIELSWRDLFRFDLEQHRDALEVAAGLVKETYAELGADDRLAKRRRELTLELLKRLRKHKSAPTATAASASVPSSKLA